MAEKITTSNFSEKVGDSGVAVVDFWAAWCGPCRMVGPVIDQLSDENEDVMIGKVNIDENPDLAVKYGIRSIPTVLFIKDGEVVDKLVGANSKNAYQEKIDKYL